MIRHLSLSVVSALVISAGGALAEGGGSPVEDVAFSFEGPFGTFDQHQLQRGLQVYTEVCSACHGLRYVPIRTLGDQGGPMLSKDQVRAFATQFPVLDENANHYLYDPAKDELRALKPTDNFPVNDTQGAPDLSLMAKARAAFHGPYGSGLNQLFKGMGGPEYIVGILTGYTGEEKDEAGSTFYANTAYPGGWIKMPPPLAGEDVEFTDGHQNDVHAESVEVAAFLMWTAEPKMMARQRVGFLSVIFLTILSVLLYLTNKRIWAPIKRKTKHG